MLVNYYGIQCTYESYRGRNVFVAVDNSREPRLSSSHPFFFVEGRWAHFLTLEEENAMRTAPLSNTIITFDKTADILSNAAMILFICHYAVPVLGVWFIPIESIMFSFALLIAAIVLVAIVRVKYPYNTLSKALGIVIPIVCAIELIIFVAVMIACSMAIDSCIDSCINCNIPG